MFAVRRMIAWASLPLAYVAAGPLADRVFEPLLAEGGLLVGTVGRIIGVGKGRGIGLMFVVLGGMILLSVLAACSTPACGTWTRSLRTTRGAPRLPPRGEVRQGGSHGCAHDREPVRAAQHPLVHDRTRRPRPGRIAPKAAMAAPSAANRRPWHFVVVTDAKVRPGPGPGATRTPRWWPKHPWRWCPAASRRSASPVRQDVLVAGPRSGNREHPAGRDRAGPGIRVVRRIRLPGSGGRPCGVSWASPST